jgi:cytidyltransferase-like protein
LVRKILIMGLPGAGKTTLANVLSPLLNAVVFNADAVRANLSRGLGFCHEDRIEHARRMGWMCDRVVEAGGTVIADFICPTEETRVAFGPAFTIWVDRIEVGRFEDTNRLFVPPKKVDLHVEPAGTPQYWAEQALAQLRPAFDPQKPTALFVGRYQPFHVGHQLLIEEGLRRVGQACIAVRHTHGTDGKNPFPFFAVKQRIETALAAHTGRFVVVALPNITNVFYGRDVGYAVERIVLDEVAESVWATQMRKLMASPPFDATVDLSTQSDTTGDGMFDQKQTDDIVVTADGSRTGTTSVFNADGSLRRQEITTTSADGSTKS